MGITHNKTYFEMHSLYVSQWFWAQFGSSLIVTKNLVFVLFKIIVMVHLDILQLHSSIKLAPAPIRKGFAFLFNF